MVEKKGKEVKKENKEQKGKEKEKEEEEDVRKGSVTR